MAVNYSFGKAVEVIAKGEDIEAIQDIGKRFPVLMCYVSKIVAKAGEDFVVFASKLPEHLTALKVNSALKAGVAADVEAEAVEDEAPETKSEAEQKPAKGRRGRPKKNVEEKPEEATEEGTNVAEGYKAMTAMELFKECKKRGIKTEPKQKASVYIKLLEADDAKQNASEDEDDDWGGDEDEKPSKPSKTKKPVEDDDDDWDI